MRGKKPHHLGGVPEVLDEYAKERLTAYARIRPDKDVFNFGSLNTVTGKQTKSPRPKMIIEAKELTACVLGTQGYSTWIL